MVKDKTCYLDNLINSAPIGFVTVKSNYEQELTGDALFGAYEVPEPPDGEADEHNTSDT